MTRQWEMKKNIGTQPAADHVEIDYVLGGMAQADGFKTADAGCINWSLDVMPPDNVTAWRLHEPKLEDAEDIEWGDETPADLHDKHFNNGDTYLRILKGLLTNGDPRIVEDADEIANDLMETISNGGILSPEMQELVDSALKIYPDVMERQEGGSHYKSFAIQPWDIIDCYMLNFYEGNIIKYMLRDKDNRLEDLKKARHYLDKLIQDVEDEV